MDFELSIVIGVEANFPDSKITFCFWHFLHSLAGKLNLSNSVEGRIIFSLAHKSLRETIGQSKEQVHENMKSFLSKIRHVLPESTLMETFSSYFEETYLQHSRFLQERNFHTDKITEAFKRSPASYDATNMMVESQIKRYIKEKEKIAKADNNLPQKFAKALRVLNLLMEYDLKVCKEPKKFHKDHFENTKKADLKKKREEQRVKRNKKAEEWRKQQKKEQDKELEEILKEVEEEDNTYDCDYVDEKEKEEKQKKKRKYTINFPNKTQQKKSSSVSTSGLSTNNAGIREGGKYTSRKSKTTFSKEESEAILAYLEKSTQELKDKFLQNQEKCFPLLKFSNSAKIDLISNKMDQKDFNKRIEKAIELLEKEKRSK